MLRTILRLCWRAQLTEGLGGLEGSKNPNRDRDRDTGGTGCSFWPSHLRDGGGDVRRDPGSRHRGEEAGSQGVPGGDGNVRVWLVNWGEKNKKERDFLGMWHEAPGTRGERCPWWQGEQRGELSLLGARWFLG